MNMAVSSAAMIDTISGNIDGNLTLVDLAGCF